MDAFKLFNTVDQKDEHCEIHGHFNSLCFKTPQGELWTDCPKCEQKKRDDEIQVMLKDLHDKNAQKALEAQLEKAAIPHRFIERTLDNYLDECDGQKKALRSARKYAAEFELMRQKGTCLIMTGKPGTGKTHLSIGIAREIMDKGYTAIFTRVIEMVRSVRETYSKESNKTEKQVINLYASPDLLILDEVGHQFGSDHERMIMFEVINLRYEALKPTILITNLDLPELRQALDERTEDRMREGGGRVIVFDWQSFRSRV